MLRARLASSVAPNRLTMMSDQMRRAARNLATSSKMSSPDDKNMYTEWANDSMLSPRSSAHWMYSIPLLMAMATSCTAVDPESRMWYPQNSIGSQWGREVAQYSMTSTEKSRPAR